MPLSEWVPTTLAATTTASTAQRCRSGARSATVYTVTTAYSGSCGITGCATTESTADTPPLTAITASGARRRQGSGSAVPSASR